ALERLGRRFLRSGAEFYIGRRHRLSLQRLGKPVTGDAAGIAIDRTERFIPARAVEARSLDAHRVEVGSHCAKAPGLLLNPFDQRRSVALAAKPLLDPEELDEQHSHPDLADNSADYRLMVTQRDGEAAIFLLPHLFGVVANEIAKDRALGLSNRALDGNRRHASAHRDVHRGSREFGMEAALMDF